jgi:hypothetical protein
MMVDYFGPNEFRMMSVKVTSQRDSRAPGMAIGTHSYLGIFSKAIIAAVSPEIVMLGAFRFQPKR